MLSKWSQLPTEVKVLALAFFVFIFGWFVIVFVNDSLRDEQDNKPCGPKSAQYNCYNLKPEACLSAWTHYEEVCLQEIKSNVQSPSQLIGSAVKKCTMKRFEQYMAFNKKNQDNSQCSSYFEELKKQ